jgi:hypothetical protein
MPAGRTCRACGAPLGGDVRWCLRCYAPAYAYSPRAPLHRGDFVDTLRPSGPDVPHWSRWEKGATSFGPVGRVVATLVVAACIVSSLMSAFFIGALGALLAGSILLRDIWKRDWIVPGEPTLAPLPDRPPVERAEEAPPAVAHIVFRCMTWAAVIALSIAFAYGPITAKAIAMALGTLLAFAWFVRSFLSR